MSIKRYADHGVAVFVSSGMAEWFLFDESSAPDVQINLKRTLKTNGVENELVSLLATAIGGMSHDE